MHTHHPACCSHRDETGAVLDCRCDELNEREPVCETCAMAAPFRGWDSCLRCGVAALLVEDRDYIRFANRVFRDDVKWLAELNAEWTRQEAALANAPYIRLTLRQAS